jgi:hypothetical protein
MGLIRSTGGVSGVTEYLETGNKAGRTQHRDELDKRTYLGGDIEEIRQCEIEGVEREAAESYKHITYGLHPLEQEVPIEIMQAIAREIVEFATPGYDIDKNVSWYAEMHEPRMQTSIDRTNEGDHSQFDKSPLTEAVQEANGRAHSPDLPKLDRLKHGHIVIGKFDKESGQTIQIRPYSVAEWSTFQSYLAAKYSEYGVVDPANHRRPENSQMDKKLILARTKGDLAEASTKRSKTNVLRSYCSDITQGAKSTEHAMEMLLADDFVESVSYVNGNTKSKDYGTWKDNRYIKVKFKDSENGDSFEEINLRSSKDDSFEHLAKLHYTEEEYAQRIDAKKSGRPERSLEELTRIVEEIKERQMKHVAKRGHGNAKAELKRREAERKREAESQAKKAEKDDPSFDPKTSDFDKDSKASNDQDNSKADRTSSKEAEPSPAADDPENETADSYKESKSDHREKMEKAGKSYEKKFSDRTIEQRTFYKIYGTNIEREVINDYVLYKKVNRQHFENRNTGSKVIDAKNGRFYIDAGSKEGSLEEGAKIAARVLLSQGYKSKHIDIRGSSDLMKALHTEMSALQDKPEYRDLNPPKGAETAIIRELIPERPANEQRSSSARMGGHYVDMPVAAGSAVGNDFGTSSIGGGGSDVTEEDDSLSLLQKTEAKLAMSKALARIREEAIRKEAEAAEEAAVTYKKIVDQMISLFADMWSSSLLMDTDGAGKYNVHAHPNRKHTRYDNPSELNSVIEEISGSIIKENSKDRFHTLKTELPAADVIAYAVKHYGARPDVYEVTEDNKINDTRNNFAAKSTVDFMTKTLNIPLSEAMTILGNLYEIHNEMEMGNLKDKIRDAEEAKMAEAAEDQMEEAAEIYEDQMENAEEVFEDQVEDAEEAFEEQLEDTEEALEERTEGANEPTLAELFNRVNEARQSNMTAEEIAQELQEKLDDEAKHQETLERIEEARKNPVDYSRSGLPSIEEQLQGVVPPTNEQMEIYDEIDKLAANHTLVNKGFEIMGAELQNHMMSKGIVGNDLKWVAARIAQEETITQSSLKFYSKHVANFHEVVNAKDVSIITHKKAFENSFMLASGKNIELGNPHKPDAPTKTRNKGWSLDYE